MPDHADPSSPCASPWSDRWWAEAARVARRLAPGPQASDDLAHETWLRATRRPPADGNLGPWIERICRNLLIDGWRSEARARRLSPDLPAPAPIASGEELALLHERRRQVRRAVLALPRQQRRALILRYQAGWSFDRIAGRLGVRDATARTRVHRALATLRARLGALRTLLMPGLLAFKPALAVLIVLAADPPALIGAKPEAPVTRPAQGAARRLSGPAVRPTGGGAPVVKVEARGESAPAEAPLSSRPARPRTATMTTTAAKPEPEAAPLRLDFENDEVEGDLQRPGGEWISAASRATHASLIELRTQFVPELIKTLEDL
jgi:RNA polymerase sigma factor (sigma-70 family)